MRPFAVPRLLVLGLSLAGGACLAQAQVAPPAPAGDPAVVSLPRAPQASVAGDLAGGLKTAALGAVKGCNYAKYLTLANNMGSTVTSLGSLWDTAKLASTRKWGIPFTDYFSLLFNMGNSVAARATAKAQQDELVYQLEQVCHSVVQADQINRQYQVMQAGNLRIGNAIKFLNASLNLRVQRVPGSDRPTLIANWSQMYNNLSPPSAGRATDEDSVWQVATTTMKHALEAAGDMTKGLDTLRSAINQAEEDLIEFAEPDSSSTHPWKCPAGYPDPNRGGDSVEVHPKRGVPTRVCGPAGPARSQQVTAHLEVLKTQLKAIQLSNDARLLQVEAVNMAADNTRRRRTAFAQARALVNY